MEGLNLNNILTGDEVDTLFDKYEDNNAEDNTADTPDVTNEEPAESSDEQDDTTEVDIDDIFSPESVGSEEDKQGGQEDTDSSKQGTSPNFYSSIAKALKEEGIFPDLEDDNEVKDAQDFKDLIQRQIDEGLDSVQRRIKDALTYGMQPNTILQYENTINSLHSITEDQLEAMNQDGENIRKQLIYQDYINRGYSQQRAIKEVEKSVNSGTDVDDAKEALQTAIEYYEDLYDSSVNQAKQQAEAKKQEEQKEIDGIKNSILNDKTFFGDISIDKKTRQKVLDNMLKPSYQDENGVYYTELQKYQRENRNEYLKNIALIFTLTDGFKDMSKLVTGKVKKEVNKGLRELEHTLRGSTGSFEGNLKLMNESPETSFRGWDIDL